MEVIIMESTNIRVKLNSVEQVRQFRDNEKI